VFVHFVDIGGIVDHHCLNFIFIMGEVFERQIWSFLDLLWYQIHYHVLVY
jgi:hypothetical protein